MKVCMFAPELLPNRGGVGSYCVGLLRELSKTVDLTVLTPQWWLGSETLTAAEIESYFGGRLRVETISQARDSFLYNPRFQWAAVRAVHRLLGRERFDLFHAHHAHMPDLLSRPLNPSPPTIRTIHSTIRGQRQAIREAQALGGTLTSVDRWQVRLGPALQFAEGLTLGRSGDYLLAVSRWSQQLLLGLGRPREQVGLARCGVDTSLFRPADPATFGSAGSPLGPTVLFAGRPALIRGAGVLAEAIPGILQAIPDARFVVTGSTPADFPAISALPPSSRSHVHFTGYLPYDRLPEVYRTADVAVAPTYYDNLPIRVLESLATGTPVVASAVGGIPEVVIPGETGLLVSPGDPKGFADAVIRLLGDPDERRRMGESARKLVTSQFTWAHTAEATRSAYETTLGGEEPRSAV